MKYAFTFAAFAIYLTVLAWVIDGAGWVLLWPAISFLAVAAAYAGLGPVVFGKRPNGSLAPWAVLLLLPYLALTWLTWHLQRRLTREEPCNEIVPSLWLGRRPFAHELPASVVLVVDLTAEFAAPRWLRRRCRYVCLPVLDAFVPDEADVAALVGYVAARTDAVYIHCAQGHGRSALVAAAVLLARGLARDAAEAETLLRKARPGVRLKPSQRRLLARLSRPPHPKTEES
jgi:protein-tyrosine phosphatase